MHVTDCVDAMTTVIEQSADASGPLHTFNLGTTTTTSVDEIATIVCDVLDVDPTFEYTGGDRGWTGDVPKMRLATDRLAALGWTPTYESTPAVRQAAIELAQEL